MNLPNQFYVYLLLADGDERIIAHNITLRACTIDKFLEFIHTEVIHILDIQGSILVDNAPFHNPCEIQQTLKMLDTSNSNCHRAIHFYMLHNGYSDTSKAMYDEMTSKTIKQYYIGFTLMTMYKQSLQIRSTFG
jgi:hypothetical protein